MSESRDRWVAKLAHLRTDAVLAVVDAMLVVGSFWSALAVRFDADIPSKYSGRFVAFLPVILIAYLASNFAWGLYGRIWRHASVAEAWAVILAGASSAAVVVGINLAHPSPIPRLATLVGAFLATALMGAARFQMRLLARRRTVADQAATRVAVVGAGEAGAAIVREMRRQVDQDRVPVVVLDDSIRKQGRSLLGVPVVAGTDAIAQVAREHAIDEVLVAIPSADGQLIRKVMEGAELAGVPLKVLPRVNELLGGRPSVRDARDLNIEDLLGRAQVATDIDAIKAVVSGSTVLITGAGGSIGSEIAKQVAELSPGRLLLLDHDETHLHDVSSALPEPAELVLADIRDHERIADLMLAVRPDVVFHAAAHKHVPILERHPVEGVRTNVLGTNSVVMGAAAAGVERLVFISSDKAVRPQNVLGYSKWLGEQLVALHAPTGARWCSVRFGNVLGSRGSVIPTFARQIAEGGPLTVTDPRMTRFFMSVREAVQLVLQASVLSTGNEIFMLDMGESVNILELAERMVRLSGHQVGTEIPVRFSGKRPGEKLSEDLQNPEESNGPTSHPSIVRLTPTRIEADTLDQGTRQIARLVSERRDDEAAALLISLARSPVLDPADVCTEAQPIGGNHGAR